MDRAHLIRIVIEGQSAGGAFLSLVCHGGRVRADWNGFTTALVVRALANAPDLEVINEALRRALDFLKDCESPERPGAFGFWPRLGRPDWAIGVTEDADDTAVIALELFRHGRLRLQDLRRIVCKTLLRHRLDVVQETHPPWVRQGVFLTWLDGRVRRNPIDCCVNANAIALMARAGLTHLPGYSEACAMIMDGIDWAGRSWDRARALAPYYPDPKELHSAIAHAVDSGAIDCLPALQMLREFPPDCESPQRRAPRPIYCSSDGSVVWTSHVLAAARRLCALQSVRARNTSPERTHPLPLGP